MNGGEQISHVTYKTIKRMNRTELSEFCQKLYAEGRNSVKAADDGIEADDVYKVIAGVRGIGPKRLAAIKQAVDTAFNQKKG